MLLSQIFHFRKNKNRYLIVVSILLLLGVFSSCQAIKLKKHKYYKEQFEIINYVFPPPVDSVLCRFLDKFYHESRNWSIRLGRYNSDVSKYGYSNIISSRNYQQRIYYVSISDEPYGISKKIKFNNSINGFYLKNMIEFVLARTNRKAVIGKGKYIIPMRFDYDDDFVGYGQIEYPLFRQTSTGDGDLVIVFTDWDIIFIKSFFQYEF